MTLSIKGKIATVIIFPVFFIILIGIFLFTVITWIVIKTLQITGILEALQYLFQYTNKILKTNRFNQTLSPEDQKIMKNVRKK